MIHRELAEALRTPIADALRAAGHDDLAEAAEHAARELESPTPIGGRVTRGGGGVSIAIDPSPGCGIGHASEVAAEVARRCGHVVRFRFNGVDLECQPGSSAAEVEGRYYWPTRRDARGSGAGR